MKSRKETKTIFIYVMLNPIQINDDNDLINFHMIHPFCSLNRQEESIYTQLMYGIRYLDVRVAHHPFLPSGDSKNDGNGGAVPGDRHNDSERSKELFWISHDSLLPQIPLTTLLSDVARFQEETDRKEIVFVDFHRVIIHTKGKTNQLEQEKIHLQLIQLVDKYLGPYLVPFNNSRTLTPNQLWKWNKTVIITYPNEIMRNQYSFLWPPFYHVGKSMEIQILY